MTRSTRIGSGRDPGLKSPALGTRRNMSERGLEKSAKMTRICSPSQRLLISSQLPGHILSQMRSSDSKKRHLCRTRQLCRMSRRSGLRRSTPRTCRDALQARKKSIQLKMLPDEILRHIASYVPHTPSFCDRVFECFIFLCEPLPPNTFRHPRRI